MQDGNNARAKDVLGRGNPPKSGKLPSLRERLNEGLEKRIEQSYRRRHQRRGSPPRSGQYYLSIDLNHRYFLYDAIWEITREAIAFTEEKAEEKLLKLMKRRSGGDDLYDARKQIIRDMRKQIGMGLNDLKNNFPWELGLKAPWEPAKWLTELTYGRGKDMIHIWSRLSRTKFEDFMKYLSIHTLPNERCNKKATMEMIRRAGGTIWGKGEWPRRGEGRKIDTIIDPDLDLTLMSEKLSLSITQLRKYFTAFTRDGFLIALPKRLQDKKKKKGGKIIYSIGTKTAYYLEDEDQDGFRGGWKLSATHWHLKIPRKEDGSIDSKAINELKRKLATFML